MAAHTPGLGLGSPGWKDHRNLRKRLLVAWCGLLRQELSTTAPRLYAQHVPGQLYLVLSLVLSFFHLFTLITPRVVVFGVCLAIFVCCCKKPRTPIRDGLSIRQRLDRCHLCSVFGSIGVCLQCHHRSQHCNPVRSYPLQLGWRHRPILHFLHCEWCGVYECGGDRHAGYRLTLAVLVFKTLYS